MQTFLHQLRRNCPLTGYEVTLEALLEVERGCSCAISNRYDCFTCPEMRQCTHYLSGNPLCPVFTEQENAVER